MRGGEVELGGGVVFEVGVEEGAEAVGGEGELAAAVEVDEAEEAKGGHEDVAFEEGSIVAELEMVGAVDLEDGA